MTTHELAHALKMLEQIAANFAWDEDPERAAAAVASHLKRFWSPEMRRMIVDAVRAGDAEVCDLSRRALAKLNA
jgi:formate dehydrogenase subunit delta